MRGQMPKPAMLPYAPQRHPCFRNATPGSRHYAARAQCPGAAPRQHSNAASSPPLPPPSTASDPQRPCRALPSPASDPQHPPVLPRGCPGSPETKNRFRLQLFCDYGLSHGAKTQIEALKRSKNGIFQVLRSREASAIAKKLQKCRVFCFCNGLDRRNGADPAKTRGISWRAN